MAIGNCLTALFSVVSWNQTPWIGVRFTISWLIMPMGRLKVSVLLLAHLKTTCGTVDFFCSSNGQRENMETDSDSRVFWKRAPSLCLDQSPIRCATHC